jgi:UDP-N-acetylglucosamine 2-epimerase
MVELCEAFRLLVDRNEEVELVFPVHLNPNIQTTVRRILEGCPRIHLLAPTDYWSFLALLRRCHFVITDSGGVQEEAPTFAKPVLVLRAVTERPEGIAAGTARLVGTSGPLIIAEAERLLHDPSHYTAMSRAHSPYGDGRAAPRIAARLEEALRRRSVSGRIANDMSRPSVDEQTRELRSGDRRPVELNESHPQYHLPLTIDR